MMKGSSKMPSSNEEARVAENRGISDSVKSGSEKHDVDEVNNFTKLRRIPAPVPWVLFLICVVEVTMKTPLYSV